MTIASLTETRTQNEVLSTTAEAIHPGIRENALDAHPGASIFAGKLGVVLGGEIGADGSPSGTAARSTSGESIRVRVKLDSNGSARRLASGYSAFSTDTSDTIRGTRANWKLYGSTAIISGLERRNNRGTAQLADLWMHKQTDSTSALIDLFAQDIYSTASPANAVTSLDSIIAAGTSSLQNASASTYSKWASRGVSAKGTAPASISFAGGSFATTGLPNWRFAHMNCSEGAINPNVMLTNDDVFRFYEARLTPQVRYKSDEMMGQIGFEQLMFRKATVFHDSYCPSGTTYFINTDTLFLNYAEGALFDMTPISDQAFQDAFSVKIIFQGQMVCSGRKYNNKVTGQTA
jgi:hypothetical protein